jgi:hypothetical protein
MMHPDMQRYYSLRFGSLASAIVMATIASITVQSAFTCRDTPVFTAE